MEEIRRSPVEVGSWNPIIYKVYTFQVVVWDFWTINPGRLGLYIEDDYATPLYSVYNKY